MSLVKNYIDTTRKSAIKMRPVLPLGQPTALGQVGVLDEDGAFHSRGTADAMLGQAVGKTTTGPGVSYHSSSGNKDVTVANFAANVPSGTFQGLGAAKARVEIEFHSNESFLWSANEVRITQIDEPQLLLNAMMFASQLGSWDRDFVLITELGVARSFTALLSAGAGSKVLLGASGRVQTPAQATIADLSVGYKAVAESMLTQKIVCKRNVTAFFQAVKVKRSAFDKVLGRPGKPVEALMAEFQEVGKFPDYGMNPSDLHTLDSEW